MRAAVLHEGEFTVTDVELPALRSDQIRVRPLANGICGSDLSAITHTEDFLAANRAAGTLSFDFDPARPLVMGHEFTSQVLEVGADVSGFQVDDVIFTLPWVVDGAGVMRTVGYSNDYPGGLGEEAIVGGSGHVKLPPGTDPLLAATLEPIATGVNGVLRTDPRPGDAALVTGAGPVGLGAVVELAARSISPIVVSDPSSVRRELALAYGATHVVDPADADPVDTVQAQAPGARIVVIEASAAPGLLTGLIDRCPAHTVFGVVGSNTRPDQLRTMTAVIKNATLLFVTGPARTERRYEALWRAAEHLQAERFDPALMVTGWTGLAGVPAAVAALRPGHGQIEHVKILVCPESDTPGLSSTRP
ncbi:zinc-binding dehydrogenase [Klenkia sp. LSe6-5]|uniref:Zinc-binding dehydrogenase n=1 Tax=Klenkia sesuvii TaxID=3103137 RepID=A0ABU8DWE2_9ACTN